MTASLLRRRRPRRLQLVDVTNHWRVTAAGGWRREVVVRTPAGAVERRLLADDHPAVVRFLDRAAVAA